jgi:hypothetical protein
MIYARGRRDMRLRHQSDPRTTVNSSAEPCAIHSTGKSTP